MEEHCKEKQYVVMAWTADGKSLRLKCRGCNRLFKVREVEYHFC